MGPQDKRPGTVRWPQSTMILLHGTTQEKPSWKNILKPASPRPRGVLWPGDSGTAAAPPSTQPAAAEEMSGSSASCATPASCLGRGGCFCWGLEQLVGPSPPWARPMAGNPRAPAALGLLQVCTPTCTNAPHAQMHPQPARVHTHVPAPQPLVHTHVYTCMHMRIHVHTHLHINAHTCVCTHTPRDTHTRVCTHTPTHTQRRSVTPGIALAALPSSAPAPTPLMSTPGS